VPLPHLCRHGGPDIALKKGEQRGTENWRILKFIGTLRLLMCRHEGVITQKNLMADASEWASFSHVSWQQTRNDGFWR
jgi:hypothetical protein